MKTCAVMQPTYIPWIGYFDLIDASDVFVILDTVQLSRGSWQIRNRIKVQGGRELLLSIPVLRTASSEDLLIHDAVVRDTERWRKKHLRSFEQHYKSAPCFGAAMAILESVLEGSSDRLADITSALIGGVCIHLGIETSIVRASELGPIDGVRDAHTANLCRAVGADSCLSARGSAVYIEAEAEGGAFPGLGIALSYQNYEHPVYPQLHGDFLPYMGILDLVANLPPAEAIGVIRSGRRPSLSSAELRAAPSGDDDERHG